MLKDHLRPNEEPKDLAYWMVVSMNIAVWLTLILLPIGALVFIANQIIQATSGSIETNMALRFLNLLTLLSIPAGLVSYILYLS